MGALGPLLIRFIAWSGIGYVANDVYDYVMASKATSTPITSSGIGNAASSAAKSFFTKENLIKVAIFAVGFVFLAVWLLPKFLPKLFKKPKR